MTRIHQEARSLGLTELTSDVSKTAEPFFPSTDFMWSSDDFQSFGA